MLFRKKKGKGQTETKQNKPIKNSTDKRNKTTNTLTRCKYIILEQKNFFLAKLWQPEQDFGTG